MSEFNLLDEQWIRVMTEEYKTEEISLSQALLHADRYIGLRGELEAQNTAILRMMLGLLYDVFSEVDGDGTPAPFEDPDDAQDRWEELWNRGSYPEEPLEEYFRKYHDRFWLFDEKFPFYQVPDAKIGTHNLAAKLIGSIGESNNKVRMFAERGGEHKEKLSFSEAARWLLYINGFDDTAAKPKGKGLPSPGAGWLGKLGLIEALGSNLFETLMLNLVFLRPDGELWDQTDRKAGKCAAWELAVSRSAERVQIPQPTHFGQLMTLQSRRILLEREGDSVIGYWLLGGDFFERENALCEPMTLWRVTEDKGRKTITPRRHNPARQIWREFGSITETAAGNERPGVVAWTSRLVHDHSLSENAQIRFRIVSVQYGDKDFFVTDEYADTIAMYSSILTEAGNAWRRRIEDDIVRCDQCAKLVYGLSIRLQKAAGASGDLTGAAATQRFYAMIDPLFRRWLMNLDPKNCTTDYEQELFEEVEQTAFRLGRDLVREAGPAAVHGRIVKEKMPGGAQEKENFYWAPGEEVTFRAGIRKICNGGALNEQSR